MLTRRWSAFVVSTLIVMGALVSGPTRAGAQAGGICPSGSGCPATWNCNVGVFGVNSTYQRIPPPIYDRAQEAGFRWEPRGNGRATRPPRAS